MTATLHGAAVTGVDYELVGPADAPVILALGGISATRHLVRSESHDAPGWWDGVAGPGAALDVTTHRLLCVDFRDGGRAADGKPASLVTTHDQAARIVEVLDELEITTLAAAIGASYGGMVVLALAERWPERVERLVVISAAHAPHPMAVGLRAVQRRIVELGLETGRVAEAMALGRAVAMTTYRTSREFTERFDVTPTCTERSADFEVERYLVQAGDKFAARMTPERFLALSLSVDLHCVVPESIAARTTVIAAEGDTLVPPAQLRQMARRLPNLHAFHTLQTRCGHDAFLTEQPQLARLLSAALAS